MYFVLHEWQKHPSPVLPLLVGLLILCFPSSLESISFNGQIAFGVVLAVLFTPLFLLPIRLVWVYWVLFCAYLTIWCLVESCFHPHCRTTPCPSQSCTTRVFWGNYTSIVMLGWPSLLWFCLLVTFSKWDLNPVNVLTDLAESKRSIPNMLAFIEQTESQGRDAVIN